MRLFIIPAQREFDLLDVPPLLLDDDAGETFADMLGEKGIAFAQHEISQSDLTEACEQVGQYPALRDFTVAVTRVTEYSLQAYSKAHAERKAHDGDLGGEVDSTTTDITVTEG
jgi:hypothetical protein